MLVYIQHTARANVAYAKSLVKDIPDAQMTAQPVAGRVMNHGAWVLGHLAATSAFTAGLVGRPVATPESWDALFGFGSKPLADAAQYPPKADLLFALDKGYSAVHEGLKELDGRSLTAPFPIKEMQGFVPTLGDGLVFLLTAHDAIHLGQLSAWRRALGLPSVMG